MMPALSGPSRPPASGGRPSRLVILLHGLGADGNDLIGLAPYWAPQLPTAEFVAPNAPFPCDMAPYGYQWFSAQDRSPAAVLAGVRAAAPLLDDFIDDALAERALDDGDLALVGFSQGTMMSLFVGLRRAKPAAGIVGRPRSPGCVRRRYEYRKCNPRNAGSLINDSDCFCCRRRPCGTWACCQH